MEKGSKSKKQNKGKANIYKLKGAKEKIISDVNGSYTGVPLDPNEKPVQDADDL